MMLLENSFSRIKKIVAADKTICLFLFFNLLVISGCCGPTALERDYGQSWAFNHTVQIADPTAASVQTPATGLSPAASTTLMNAYNKSFAGKQSGGGGSTTINLGGITSGAGGGGGN
jgi:hypothetical protein